MEDETPQEITCTVSMKFDLTALFGHREDEEQCE